MSCILHITEKYLWLPIRCSEGGEPSLAEEHLIFLRHNGKIIRYFSAALSDWDNCSRVVSYPVGDFLGETVEASEDISCFRFSATVAELPDTMENLRPRFHFTPRSGWLNDPNGLYYRNGLWHLFYQLNPFSLGMGVMHWGLAVSSDLVNWRDRGVVLFPDGHGATWSGSAVVDDQNTSGLARGGEAPVCLFYTAAGRDVPGYDGDFSQCLAVGYGEPPEHFDRFPETLIGHLQAENRDPRVLFCRQENCWLLLMLRAYDRQDEAAMRGTVSLFRSNDLLHWQELQQIRTDGGACPDFFELEFEDAPGKSAWVLMNIPHTYMTGSFDGKRFQPDGPPRSYVEYCSCQEERKRFDPASPFNLCGAYPAQTFSHAPGGRRVGVLKLSREFPGAVFNSQISLPIEFSLRHNRKGETVLLKRPAGEIRTLIQNQEPSADAVTLWGKAVFSQKKDGEFRIRNCVFRWNAKTGSLDCAGHMVRPELTGDHLEVEFFADTATLEIFVNDGEFYLPGSFVPDGAPLLHTIFRNGSVQLTIRKIADTEIARNE